MEARTRATCALVVTLALFIGACSGTKHTATDSASSSASSAKDAMAYTEPGPSPVGVTTLTLPSGPSVEVWYPAVAGTTGAVTYDVRDFVPQSVKSLLTGDVPATFSYPGMRDAPVASGRYPLVLYSHGFSGMRVGSSHLMSHLASWGMVVAAPDHPSRDLMHALSFQFGNSADAVDDIAATLTLMQAEDTRPGSMFASHVDASRAAVVGHSAGGVTAKAAAAQLSPVRGYVAMASGVFPGRTDTSSASASASASSTTTTTAAPPDKPSLFVAGANDQVASMQEVVRPAFDRAAVPTRLWVIDRAGHNLFDDFCTFGNGTGIIGVAEASGLGPLLASPQFAQFKTLGEDGCKPPDAPVAQTWPIVDHAVTAWLRNTLGLDPQPVGLGPEVAGAYAVPVTIEQRI